MNYEASFLEIEKPKKIALKKEKVQSLSSGMVLVQTKYSLISTGTEKLVYRGQVPDSCSDKMSFPLMKGAFHFPIRYGYSLVGKVIDGDPKLL